MNARSAEPDQSLHFAELAWAALPLWDLDVVGVSLIKLRENAVYRLDLAGGAKKVLRVHRLGYHSDAALRSESEWMRALAATGIRVPTLVPSKRGLPFELVSVPSMEGARQVDVLDWIDGVQLGSVEEGVEGDLAQIARKYEILGEVAARMHQQAASWRASDGFVRHRWCESGLVGTQPLWGRFWELEALDESQRDLLETLRCALQQDLAKLPKDIEGFGLIHADLVPENLLIDGSDVHVIDFDDAGHGWHLFDLATSLYFLSSQPYFETARRALVEGYRRHRALSDAELQRLPMFLAARGTTYLGWVHERKDTETARELTPFLVQLACAAAEDYLRKR